MVRTLEAAAAWVDKVGLALLFPKADVVLPSLWEQVNGSAVENWSIREPDGKFVRWTDEMAFLWGAKDDLPAQGLVCVGKHLARLATCVSPPLVPLLVAAADRDELAADEEAVLAAVTAEGPLTGPQLRDVTLLPKKVVDRTVALAAPKAPAHEQPPRRAGRAVGRDRTRSRRQEVAAPEAASGARRRRAASSPSSSCGRRAS